MTPDGTPREGPPEDPSPQPPPRPTVAKQREGWTATQWIAALVVLGIFIAIFGWVFQDSDHDRLRDNMMQDSREDVDQSPTKQQQPSVPTTDLELERSSDGTATGTGDEGEDAAASRTDTGKVKEDPHR